MFRNRFDLFARFEDDGSPGGDASDGGDDARTAGFQKLMERYNNDATRLADSLHHENFQNRQQIKQLESQLSELRGQVPGEGAVVLSGDDAAAWNAYKDLGAPDAVQTALQEKERLQGELAAAQRAEQIRSVAESAGYKPSVLAKLDATARAEGKELAFELRDVEQDGATVKQAIVKDGEAEHALTEYAAREWADFLPALAVTPAEGGGNSSRATGTPHPSQQATGGGSRPETTKAVAESYISKTYRSANNGSNGN